MHAHHLLNIAVQHGNSKEVLLKLIEASEHLERYADEETWAGEPGTGLHMILLQAQDQVLRRINTARPSRFLAEYTKCILTVMSKVADTIDRPEMMIFWTDHLQESLSVGAIRHMQTQAKTEIEKLSTSALLKSFYTYVVEYIGQQSEELWSYRLFQSRYPDLKVPSTEMQQVTADLSSATGVLDTLSEIFTDFDLMEFFACGSWAATENTEEDDGYASQADQESGTGLDTLDIPFSPPGSAILLAHYLRNSNLRSQPQGTTGLDILSITKLEQCMMIIVELCIRRSPHTTTLDACLYITYLVIHQVNPPEVFQSLSYPDSSTNPAEGDLQFSSNAYDRFLLFMQALSSISATSGHPQLRMTSHYMVRDVLWRCTDDFVLKWFLDTFQNCPFESLRTASVGLFKDFLALRSSLMWSVSQSSDSVNASTDGTASLHKPRDGTKSSNARIAINPLVIHILHEILKVDDLRIESDHTETIHGTSDVQTDDEIKASGLWLQSSNLIIFLLLQATTVRSLTRTSGDQSHQPCAAVPANLSELSAATTPITIADSFGTTDLLSLVRSWVSLVSARIDPNRTSVAPLTRDILNMSLFRISQLTETL